MSETIETQAPKTRSDTPIRPQTEIIRGTPQVTRKRLEPTKPKTWPWYLLLVALTFGCFGVLLQSKVLWSPYDQVERTEFQTMESWTEAWSIQSIRNENPVELSSYFVETAIPLSPAVTHRSINLMLHICAALILLKTLEALKLPAAFSASLVFALHPTVIQSIFWPGYRGVFIALIFILASLFFGIRNRGVGDFIALLILSSLAFALHKAALMLPPVLALCIFYQKPHFELKDYNRVLPLLCIALFIGVWRASDGNAVNGVGFEQITQNLFFYLRQAVIPTEPALFYPTNVTNIYSVGSQNYLLPFIFFAPFYILIAFNLRRSWARAALVGLTAYILFLISGLTKSGIYIDGTPAYEDHAHYIALPMILALLFCGAGGVIRRLGNSGKVLWSAGFSIFMVIQISISSSLAFAISDRTQMWKSLSDQWKDSAQTQLALVNTVRESGSELLSEKEIIRILIDILEKEPDRVEERILLARFYRDDRQNTNALREYTRIIRDSKPSIEVLEEAAIFYDTLGLHSEAKSARARISER